MDEKKIANSLDNLGRTIKRAIIIYIIFWAIPALANASLLIYVLVNLERWMK